MKGLSGDKQGVEPLVLKMMAGIVLLAVGLGIGLALYHRISPTVEQMLTYTVTVTPSGATIGRPSFGENTVHASISVEQLAAYSKTVSLSATGQPNGVIVTFDPASGTPTFGSTMTIKVDNTAAIKTTTITIKAIGADGTEKSALFELTVS